VVPVAAAPPVQAPAPAPPTVVSVSADEFARLRSSDEALKAFQKQQSEAVAKAEQERLEALAAKGEADLLLKELRETNSKLKAEWNEKYTNLESTYHGEKKVAVVATSTSGVQWVSDFARDQALAVINSELTTVKATDGSIQVVHKLTGRPASQCIAEQLASPAFSHFQKATATGGSGSQGGSRPAPMDEAPKSFTEQVIANFNAQRDDPSLPIWARPTRFIPAK